MRGDIKIIFEFHFNWGDLKTFQLKKDPNNAEAQEHLQSIGSLKGIEDHGRDLYDQADYTGAIHVLSPLIEVS